MALNTAAPTPTRNPVSLAPPSTATGYYYGPTSLGEYSNDNQFGWDPYYFDSVSSSDDGLAFISSASPALILNYWDGGYINCSAQSACGLYATLSMAYYNVSNSSFIPCVPPTLPGVVLLSLGRRLAVEREELVRARLLSPWLQCHHHRLCVFVDDRPRPRQRRPPVARSSSSAGQLRSRCGELIQAELSV